MMAPQRVVSLWDMIQLLAPDLIASSFNLGLLSEKIVSLAGKAKESGVQGVIYDRNHMAVALLSINNIRDLASELSLPATYGAAVRCGKLIEQLTPLSADRSEGSVTLSEQIGYTCHGLSTTLSDELGSVFFVNIQASNKDYLDNDISIFGEDVDKKFPKALGDISEAAKCLAFSRPTASVFHLMRVMEHCIQRLGKKLKIKANIKNESWYVIGTQVNNAVNAMPGKTSRESLRKQKYGLAYANLNGVRMAWRNDVMHPKATYTEEEAQTIFNHVGAFLKALAPLV